MKTNAFSRFITSLPVILFVLYFSRILGVCLILFRFLIGTRKQKNMTPVVLAIVGVVVLIPIGLDMLFHAIKFNTSGIPYFNDIVTSNTYTVGFMKYSKALLIIAIIFAIIATIMKKVGDSVTNYLKSSIEGYTDKQIEYEKENDLKIKEQQERAKNTQVVKCKKCGGTNIITEKIGKCKYCRNTIVGK